MLIKTPLLHQSFGPGVFLSFYSFCLSVCLSVSLSLYFWLIPWSAEARWAHFLAWASKTLSRRRTAPSPTREGARCLRAAAQALRTLLVLHVNQGTSASFSLLFSYRRLWTTRFRSIKGPTLNWPVYISIQPYHPLFLLGQWTTGRKILKKKTFSGTRGSYHVTQLAFFVLFHFPMFCVSLFIRCHLCSPQQGVPDSISRTDFFIDESTLLNTSSSLLPKKLKCMWKMLHSD